MPTKSGNMHRLYSFVGKKLKSWMELVKKRMSDLSLIDRKKVTYDHLFLSDLAALKEAQAFHRLVENVVGYI